jgi:hypothetical protein
MPDDLTSQQRQTLAARQALDRRFSSPEAKSAYYRALATKAHTRRLVLSGDEAAALVRAYRALHGVFGLSQYSCPC